MKNKSNQAQQKSSIVIQPNPRNPREYIKDLFDHRELLFFLVWRDIKVRYKQTVLGITWIVLKPVVEIIILNLIFGNLLKVPTNGIPYPIFLYSALLPWNYFSTSLTRASSSLVSSSSIIKKIYFPRLIIPISSAITGLIDFGFSFIIYILMMFLFQIPLTPRSLLLPIFLVLAVVTALGFSFWFSIFNAQFRDIRYIIPFLLQIWRYLTPVVYGSSIFPERFRFLLGLNPIAGVVDGFRWALLGNLFEGAAPNSTFFLISVFMAVSVFISGFYYFIKNEHTIVDVI